MDQISGFGQDTYPRLITKVIPGTRLALNNVYDEVR